MGLEVYDAKCAKREPVRINQWHSTVGTHVRLTNDYGLYHATREVLEGAQDRETALRDFVEQVHNIEAAAGNAGLLADLLGWALAIVNWREVADAFNEEEES